MKILIAGAGSLGKYYAARLCRTHELTLLCRTKEQADLLEQSGLGISGLEKIRIAPGRFRAGCRIARENFDLIICLVKAYSVKKLLKKLSEDKIRSGELLFLQNGAGFIEESEKYAVRISENIFTGITGIGAYSTGETSTRLTGLNPVIIGVYRGAGGSCAKTARIISASGIRCFFRNKILPAVYGKLLLNCAINPVGTVFGIKNGGILSGRVAGLPYLAFSSEIMREVAKVYKLFKIEPGYSNPEKKLKETLGSTKDNFNSMLQDIRKSSETEIEYITGHILSLAKKAGVNLPVNRMFYEMVRELEKDFKKHA